MYVNMSVQKCQTASTEGNRSRRKQTLKETYSWGRSGGDFGVGVAVAAVALSFGKNANVPLS